MLGPPGTGRSYPHPSQVPWVGSAVPKRWQQHFEQLKLPFCSYLSRIRVCVCGGVGRTPALGGSAAHVLSRLWVFVSEPASSLPFSPCLVQLCLQGINFLVCIPAPSRHPCFLCVGSFLPACLFQSLSSRKGSWGL